MKKTVNLDLETLLRECSIHPQLAMDNFLYFSYQNRENIHQIFKYKKFNDDFTSSLTCYNDGSSIIGYIRPSYDEFLRKLISILNIKGQDFEDNEELTNLMLERLEVLKNIKSERELLIEFPHLYNDLTSGRRYLKDIERLRQQEKYTDEQYASGEHYYYGCALKKSLPNFIKTQSEMYRRYITDRDKLKALQETKAYNGFIQKNFSLPKIYLYVVHEYLKKCETTACTDSEIKMYLDLIKKYLDSNIDKSPHITLNDKTVINIYNIRRRYYNLKKQYEENSKTVEWVLVPPARGTKVAYKKGTPRISKLSIEELEALRKIGESKQKFYEQSNYLAKAIGLRRYHGYVAYIYKNGQVILDREYNDIYPRTAKGNAIYNMHVIDFEYLSRKDKSILMRHPKVGRIIHSKSWETKVNNVISKAGTKEDEEKTKMLIKRLQKKVH